MSELKINVNIHTISYWLKVHFINRVIHKSVDTRLFLDMIRCFENIYFYNCYRYDFFIFLNDNIQLFDLIFQIIIFFGVFRYIRIEFRMSTITYYKYLKFTYVELSGTGVPNIKNIFKKMIFFQIMSVNS